MISDPWILGSIMKTPPRAVVGGIIYIVIMYTYHPEIMFGCWRLMISSGLTHLPGFLGSLLRGPFATVFFGLE